MSFTTKIQFLAVCFHLQDFVAYGNAYGNSSWRHVESENISVLTISGNSRNVKIIVPSPPFYYHPPPANLWYSLNIPWGSFYYDPAILRYFSWTPTSLLIRPPLQSSTEEYMFPRHSTHHLHVIIYNLIVDKELYPERSLTMNQSKDQFENKTKSFAILNVNFLKKKIVWSITFFLEFFKFHSELFKLIAAKAGKNHNSSITLRRQHIISFLKFLEK